MLYTEVKSKEVHSLIADVIKTNNLISTASATDHSQIALMVFHSVSNKIVFTIRHQCYYVL